MEFVKAMEIHNRMCKKYQCHNCPLGKLAYDKGYGQCLSFMRCLPKEAEECLVEWNKEHPIKTYATDFFEKFPNAPKDSTGAPKTCLANLGLVDSCPREAKGCYSTSCLKCWNQPMEE